MPDADLQKQRLRQYKGEISPLFEGFYIEALLFNTTAARWAAAEVAELCYEREVYDTYEISRVLDAAQTLVTHLGAISRFLWPVRHYHNRRGEQLRAALQTSDTSTLSDRSLRDSLEHFDERLDLYLCKNLAGYVIPQSVGPLGRSDGIPVHRFRAFDPSTGTFELLGRQHQLYPLVQELNRIYSLLIQMRTEGRFSRCDQV